MKTKKGFTLIELLIVIAIIAILASIGMVSYTGARKKVRDTATLTSVSSAIPAMTICDDDAGTINEPAEGAVICTGGGDGETYPEIGRNDKGATYNGDLVPGTDFTFSVTTGSGKLIECGHTGCKRPVTQ